MASAKTVGRKETLELQDGREVTVRPLVISKLKLFMDAWDRLQEVDKDEDLTIWDVYLHCAGIGISTQLKEDFPDGVNKDTGELSEEYMEYCGDVLDTDTIFVILEVAGGMKLTDPKLLDEVAKEVEAAGKN